MAGSDLIKKIQKLIKDEVRPVKDLVEMTKKKVDSQQIFLMATNENVRSIKEQQSIINEKLDEVQNTQDQHTEALVTIESTIKVYSDMYKLNNDNMKKLEKRVETLENGAGIQPPPELTLAEIK